MIALACDHAALGLKKEIMKYLDSLGLEWKDFGTYTTDSCNYPEFVYKAAKAVASGECDRGIICCGTGVGISISANKIKGIRAALCGDWYSAKYTRLHNDANVLCMGGRVIGAGLAAEITDIFLETEFEGGRHARRVEKIMKLEDK